MQRTGGDLVQRELMYSIDGGDGQFNDVRGRLIFGKGKRSDTITISPKDDNIPEVQQDGDIVELAHGVTCLLVLVIHS